MTFNINIVNDIEDNFYTNILDWFSFSFKIKFMLKGQVVAIYLCA